MFGNTLNFTVLTQDGKPEEWTQGEGCLLKAKVLTEDTDCHMETNVTGVWIKFYKYLQVEK